jgi:hypothetical protein
MLAKYPSPKIPQIAASDLKSIADERLELGVTVLVLGRCILSAKVAVLIMGFSCISSLRERFSIESM